jgi:NAD(P)-dependent dehydrogenase (short-subunit alcohol dehydrogenase family)
MEAIFVGTLDGVFKVTRTSGNSWQLAANDLKRLEVMDSRFGRISASLFMPVSAAPMIAKAKLADLRRRIPLKRIGEPEDVAELHSFSLPLARGKLPAAFLWLTAGALQEDPGLLR